jgi:hypothetical protein
LDQLIPIEQKTVNFDGAEILGVKADNGKVYIGVKWVCQGIGLDEDRIKYERKKLQEDLVLKQGGQNITLPTNGGNQEVLCIELDFLPLWLAKISITPNMVENNPELVQRMVDYQLKAKDVLAKAFLPQQSFDTSFLTKEMQAIFVLDKRSQEFDSRIGNLENNMTIDHGQKRTLQKLARTRVLGMLGGKSSFAYQDRSLRGETFSSLWNDYKDYFNIEAYGDTLKADLERAKQYIIRWAPHGKVLRDIEEATQQLAFN